MANTVHQSQRPISQSFFGALGFVIASFVPAVIGGIAASSAAAEYQSLNQPSWAPPSQVFGPVWTALYLLIAASGWLVWRRSGLSQARWALMIYGFQLLLNALWTPLFFGAGRFGLAFAEICVLLIAIVVNIVAFWRHSRVAAGLLLPYLGWVGFATVLNWSVWQLNP